RLRGTPATRLSFANPFVSAGEYGTYDADSANEIFNPAARAVINTATPGNATTTRTEEYLLLANNEIEGIGSTCGNSNCADLLIAIDNLREDICIRINNLLGVTNPSGAPPEDGGINLSAKFLPGPTPFGYSNTIGDEDSALEGQ